ncbi:MAG: hypothetical protein FIB08_03720 [Candidatus Methanoperedens sp.]|nr:hypothetical protein [Candidatus Methanoperedens sp.]
MRWFAGVEDAMGIDWHEFPTRGQAEAYAESVNGVIGFCGDDGKEILEERIKKCVDKYLEKKAKHITIGETG